jgi:flavin reductase (DIM6/NTAB) family NADH-FMN oxidoreductase RutF
MNKQPFNPDKRTWHPSVLPGHIVIVSTVSEAGQVNLAPKSWITMVALAGPVIVFGCNVEHTTYQNIVATHEFVINVPDESLMERVWALITCHGDERLRQSGFTLQVAQKVKPPIIAECRAHLECEFDDVKLYGHEVAIFGKIVAASIDADCLTGTLFDQYAALRPVFFLEDSTYGVIEAAKRVGST